MKASISAILFLVCSLLLAQTQSETAMSKKPAVAINNLDTIRYKPNIPASLHVIYWQIVVSTKGSIFRLKYSQKDYGYNAKVKDLIDDSKTGGKIYYEDITVLKDGRQLKLPDQSVKF